MRSDSDTQSLDPLQLGRCCGQCRTSRSPEDGLCRRAGGFSFRAAGWGWPRGVHRCKSIRQIAHRRGRSWSLIHNARSARTRCGTRSSSSCSSWTSPTVRCGSMTPPPPRAPPVAASTGSSARGQSPARCCSMKMAASSCCRTGGHRSFRSMESSESSPKACAPATSGSTMASSIPRAASMVGRMAAMASSSASIWMQLARGRF